MINSGLLTSTNNNLVTTQNILFSVPTFTVPANYKIIETPARPEYLHITTSTISEINLRIVDENDKLYDFNGEKIVIRLHILHKCKLYQKTLRLLSARLLSKKHYDFYA